MPHCLLKHTYQFPLFAVWSSLHLPKCISKACACKACRCDQCIPLIQEGDYSDPFTAADQRELQQRRVEKARSQAALTSSHQPAAQPQTSNAAVPSSAPQLGFGSTAAPSSAPPTGQSLPLLHMPHLIVSSVVFRGCVAHACMLQTSFRFSPFKLQHKFVHHDLLVHIMH